MRLWMAASFGLAAAIGLISLEAPRASAQPKGGAVAETFRTADGVELHGLYHAAGPAAKNASGAPVVVFLYPPGQDRDMTKGDWSGLAKELTKEGYHVFQFDWRGHGKSTSIRDTDKFWGNVFLNGGNNFNRHIKGAGKRPLKNDIFYKDLGGNATRYMPAYLQDLAAVRAHLDTKNDNRALNTGSIYLVGAGDAAALGMAWLTAEWNRPDVMPNVNKLGFGVASYDYVPQALVGGVGDAAGADFGGAVWLTPTRPTSFPERAIKTWVSNRNYAPKLRENNPMLFLYADKDATGKRQSEFYYSEVLVADPRKGSGLAKLDQTFIKNVKGGEKLQGVALLGQNATLKTEDTIVQYFAAIQKQRQSIASKTREYKNPYFIDLRWLGFNP